MLNWIRKIIRRSYRSDLQTNPQGLDDGGLNLSGPLFPGQSQIFTKREKGKKNRNVNKKKQPDYSRRPGEQVPGSL